MLDGTSSRRRRLPGWIKLVAALFAVVALLFLFGSLAGEEQTRRIEKPVTPDAPAP